MAFKQYFDDPIAEIIQKRTSVRSYEPTTLSVGDQRKVVEFMDQVTGPFDPKVRFELIEDLNVTEKTGGKVGTYGVIKGAKSYILVSVEKGYGDLEQVGYTLEKIILFATSLGLGTCWLGGTFKREGFQNLMKLKEQEFMPVVTPIGYPQNKKTMMDRIIRLTAGSDHRFQWEQLFFEKELNNPLSKESIPQQYVTALEMVRMAPSASNKQPWRIVKEKNQLHFYLKRNKGYAKGLGFDIQRIDLGIAMCHFEMAINEEGINGQWVSCKNIGTEERPEGCQYISSFQVESITT